MSKKQLLGSTIILIILCFVCKFIYDEFKVVDEEKKTRLIVDKNDSKGLSLYYQNKGINYYLYNIDEIMVEYGDHDLELNKSLETKQINMDFIINYVKEDGQVESYDDGGTINYNNSELTVLKCQTLNGNNDYYFGPSNMKYKEGFCLDKPYVCSFTRTYLVLDISPSHDENYKYLTLREFQGEEVVTVKISNIFTDDIIEEQYYEFKFGSLGNNENEDIKNIFDNHILLSMILTDKTGLEQINDDICR